MPIINTVLGIDGLNPILKIRTNLILTLKFVSIFVKIGTHDKLIMLIMNTILPSV